MEAFWQNDPAVWEDLTQTHAAMRELVTDETGDGRITEIIQELVDNPGKMLRPALLLLAARLGRPRPQPVRGLRGLLEIRWSRVRLRLLQSCNGNPRRARRRQSDESAPRAFAFRLPIRLYRLAGALELLHLASLVHDDIVDDSELRRGREALHITLDSRRAVLVGDHLFGVSFDGLLNNGSPTAVRTAVYATRRLSRGAISETADYRLPTPREYRRQIFNKTAILFISALQIGAQEGNLPACLLRRLERIGCSLGLSFQIIDDILDLTGDPQHSDKPRDTDLQEGVYTLPLIYAVRGGGDQAEELKRMLNPAEGGGPPFTQQQRDRIRIVAAENGGVAAARREAAVYAERALREIDALPAGSEQIYLRRVVQRLLVRR